MTANAPKVSVVVPCFNHGEFLADAVASVISMNRGDVELIVVDDGSTDERTRREMDALATKGIHVIRQENKGLAAARNAGVRTSKGEYIFPLDADDRIRAAYVESAIQTLDANPPIGVVYGDLELFGTCTGHWVTGPFDPHRLMLSNYIACSAYFRRVIWEQNGGYDGTMPVQGFEDWDFWLGALEHGWKFAHTHEALFEYRQHGESMITNARKFERHVAQFVARKHGPLYRQAWLELADERDSGKLTFRNLRRIVKARIKRKLGMNGNQA